MDLPSNKKNEVNVDGLDSLLEKILAPPDRAGLSDALQLLQASAKSISNLAPSSKVLADLVYVIEEAQKLKLNKPIAARDNNLMFGRYKEYPMYSLFTQRAWLNEPPELKSKFNIVCGLLLACIWLNEKPWNPEEVGFLSFITELRKIRHSKHWKKLSNIEFDTKSIQTIIESLSVHSASNQFAANIHELAVIVGKALELRGPDQSKTTRTKSLVQTEINFLLPPQPKQSVPKIQVVKQKQQKKPDIELGDQDEWQVGGKKRARPVVTQRPPTLEKQEISLRKPTKQIRGFDNSETGIASTIVQASDSLDVKDPSSLALQKLQVLDARYATEFDNQFLPYSWEVLNQQEVQSIVCAIKSILVNKNEAENIRIGALIAGLSIMTSRSPEELASFKYFVSPPIVPLATPAILVNHMCWYSPFPPLERFEPDDRQALWLKQIGDGCYLPLPNEILSALTELTSDGKTLSEALNNTADELTALTDGFCRKVRADAKSRANTSWLRSIMFHKLLALTGDDVGSVATLGNTEHAPNVGLYYATFEQYEWQKYYSQATSSLGFTPSLPEETPTLPYGSRQYPEEEKLRNWIATFSQLSLSKCKGAKSTLELIDAHNHFSGYTFLMLLASTGHRPADVFTFSITSIDLNNGWIIISDKITSASTRVRLIPLPPIVVKQLQNYLVHLRNLSKRIQTEYPELADKISLLTDDPCHPLISFFFWLDDMMGTSAIDVPSFTKKYSWPFEGNVFRHCLATGLRKNNVLAEYIAILMGHVGIGQFGFGKFSALSPSSWKNQLTPALNCLVESQGWQAVAGLTHTRAILPFHNSTRPRLLKIPQIDTFEKVRAHIVESKNDRKIVRAAFLVTRRNTPDGMPRDEFLDEFKNEIIRQSVDAGDRLAKRLNIHLRYIRLHRNALNPNSIPGWASDMHSEDSPHEPDTLTLAKCASNYRDSIIVIAQEFKTFSIEERITFIQISAILYGAQLRENLVFQIPALLSDGVRWFDGMLWIDFADHQSGGSQRWFPDPVTALLIARHIVMPSNSTVAHVNKTQQNNIISKLLGKMESEQKSGINVISLNDLIKIGKAYFALHLPGLLRAYAGGDVRSASLVEGCWLRILSGRPVAGLETESRPERESIIPLRHMSADVKSARGDLKNIFTAIRDELSASSSGATNLKGARANHLKQLAERLGEIETSKNEMPSILFAIISWSDHLATEGSKVAGYPAISTIYSYVTDISNALVEFCSEVNFVELSDAELIDIYQRVIDSGAKNTRASRASSLRWFHEYCEEEFDIPEIDWDEVAPGLTNDKRSVSANLVTFSEYDKAKSLIENHPRLDKRDRQMHLVALILIYRCGLRLGELLRITVSDLTLEENGVLLVRNGIYGKTKSRAGIRQVPWLVRLNDAEMVVLKDWIQHRQTIANGDPWEALFGMTEESRTLEARLKLSRVLTEVLRFATGDPRIKVHHLRHGAGTCALAISLSAGRRTKVTDAISDWFNIKSADTNNAASEFREFHLGHSAPTRRIVYAVSQALGHSSPRTTCWHYGHLLDFSLFEHVTNLATLRNIDVTQLSGMSQNSIGLAVHKKPDKTAAELALNFLLKDFKGLEPKTQLADQPLTLESFPSDAPIQPITSPKLAHTILTDIVSGFPVEKIAGRYSREIIEIIALENTAIKIEKKTGYYQFRLTKLKNGNDKSRFSIAQHTYLRKLLTGHGNELIRRFQKAIENKKAEKILDEGLEVWQNNYQRSLRGLRIPYSEDLDVFVEILKLLDFKNQQIVLSGISDDPMTKKQEENIKKKFPNLNIIRRSGSYRTNKRTSIEITHAPTLLVSINSENLKDSVQTSHGGASLAMTKLHHLFFLTAVIKSCSSKIE